MQEKRKIRASFVAFIILCVSLAVLGCGNRQPKADTQKEKPAEETAETESWHIHDYADMVFAPTYTTVGYTLHTCKSCGDTYKDTYLRMPSDIMYPEAVRDYLLPVENYSRKRTQNPEFVMLHFSSAVVIDRDDPYDIDTNRSIFVNYRVSTHYLIDRNGTVYCYVPENRVALHAGYGTWGDNPKYTDFMNDFAIGIELLGIGSQKDMAQYLTAEAYNGLPRELIGFTDAQYASLKSLVRDICERNNIPIDRQHVIGHQAYSPSKTDPGELLDWNRVLP